MANTVYTIHAAANHAIVAVYEFEGNVGIDHAYPARQVAMDHTDGKTRRFYLHNGVGVIATFVVRNGEAHEILPDLYQGGLVVKLFAKKGRPDHQVNVRNFEHLMWKNNDIRFYQPDPERAPWLVQAEINGVLVNFWPHLLKGNIAGCKAVVGYGALQRMISEARADDTDIRLLE